MVNLREKVAVISGASSGIGRAAAEALARKGAFVVLAGRRAERLEELARSIEQYNPNCLAVPTDATKEDDVRRLFDQAEGRFGRVDLLVNSAGRGLKASIPDITFDQWHQVMAANLDTVFLCSQQAMRRMIGKQVRGCIITVGSIAGLYSVANFAAYCAAKHAVTGFMRSLRWEARRHGIRAHTIFPARVDTEFFADYAEKPSRNQLLAPSDIARVIVALAGGCPFCVAAARTRNFVKRVYTFCGL